MDFQKWGLRFDEMSLDASGAFCEITQAQLVRLASTVLPTDEEAGGEEWKCAICRVRDKGYYTKPMNDP